MKFGIREVANLVFRAKQQVKIGDKTFAKDQPVLYIDSAATSSLEQAATTVYAQGGRGNARLIAWEGEKTLTVTFEDALLSPIGFAILSGAGLFKGHYASKGEKTHFHMSGMATMAADGTIDLTDAIADLGAGAEIDGAGDAPIYVMEVEEDGSITGELVGGNITATGTTITVSGVTEAQNVMVDYYVVLDGNDVYEADITGDTFAGSYYVEAETLFRDQNSGADLPANLTFPNVKLQSNFTITMASSGDPSTFTFTMDAFPGYTYFNKTQKVLCVLQVATATQGGAKVDGPVMYDHVEGEDPNP